MASKEVTKPVSSGRSDAESASWLQRLPSYSRSLLKIKVPVTVTLATSKQPVRTIVGLVPGSIIQFEKLCDEMLTLEVGNQRVAEGETVKVGDKFGLRVTSMVLPEERFHTVQAPRTGVPSQESPVGQA
jgi:flagellar motor switch protein FliN/FliY